MLLIHRAKHGQKPINNWMFDVNRKELQTITNRINTLIVRQAEQYIIDFLRMSEIRQISIR